MVRWPFEFPWVVQGVLVVAALCFAGWLLVGVLAVVRWWRARRVARPGFVEDFWPRGSESWFEKEGR